MDLITLAKQLAWELLSEEERQKFLRLAEKITTMYAPPPDPNFGNVPPDPG